MCWLLTIALSLGRIRQGPELSDDDHLQGISVEPTGLTFRTTPRSQTDAERFGISDQEKAEVVSAKKKLEQARAEFDRAEARLKELEATTKTSFMEQSRSSGNSATQSSAGADANALLDLNTAKDYNGTVNSEADKTWKFPHKATVGSRKSWCARAEPWLKAGKTCTPGESEIRWKVVTQEEVVTDGGSIVAPQKIKTIKCVCTQFTESDVTEKKKLAVSDTRTGISRWYEERTVTVGSLWDCERVDFSQATK
jgi:hypothetical protein